jgi:hypothetical protein
MQNVIMSARYLDKIFRRTPASLLRALTISAAILICGINSVNAQTPPCPTSGSSTSFTFEPTIQGDSTTQTINLAPCETIEIQEWHDMAGDLNRGTSLTFSYFNSNGQRLFHQNITGFSTFSEGNPQTMPLRDSTSERSPWVGVRNPALLPATLKVESTSTVGYGNPSLQPTYHFTIVRNPRPEYNVGAGGYEIANALPALSLPSMYKGSVRQADDFWAPPQESPSDEGQFFKIHLCVGQSIYIYGIADAKGVYSHLTIDLIYENGNLAEHLVNVDYPNPLTPFISNPYTNATSTEVDLYVRVWSRDLTIAEFTLNIDSWVPSDNSAKPVAPDATGSGGSVSSEEYHLPAGIDNDVLTGRMTELWAKMYWPTNFSGGPYPLVAFLHGNHDTCGTGTNPRVDQPTNPNYTLNGVCPPGYSVVNNHLGYEYLATQLASRGYVVTSINANRGITGAPNPDFLYPDDGLHIFSRGRLVLKHLQYLNSWNSGPGAFITGKTLGTQRNNATGWFGMQITVGSQAITVYSLGRIFVTGSNQTHSLQIVRASDNLVVGSVSISMTGGTNGQFKYANLATPVRLAANTSYYIASSETRNKDKWYDSNTSVTSTSLATVNGRVTSTNGTTWSTSGGVPNQVYIPLDFKYQILNVNLANKLDFTNVGLMGHSRGGQGVLAAYNLYRNSGIDPRDTPADIMWSNRIPAMNIKGIFEIGPTDFLLPTASNGTGAQWLGADGIAWNVLLPMCDGDVRDLQGVRIFDRLMTGTESPATQKSTYTAWGTNHNFFNTEWQQSEVLARCTGAGNTQLFANPAPDGTGSSNQRMIGAASLLAFFRANVGASASPLFNQNFNPRYEVPNVTTITPKPRVDQGFTPSPNPTVTKVLFDFSSSSFPGIETLNIPSPILGTIVPNHASSLSAAFVTWGGASCGTYLQVNWQNPNTGDNISGYQTLDFRISRADDPLNSSTSTNFQIQLIAANGDSTGASVPLKKYVSLTGPVGIQDVSGPGDGLHPILQTVRVPLTDFANANLTQVRGVRFIFSDTTSGSVFIANLRLSTQP